MMTWQHHLMDITFAICFVCSVLHSLLPPWEAFADFPRMQKVYKLMVYIVGYLALNARSSVYKSLSTSNGEHPSAVNVDSVDEVK